MESLGYRPALDGLRAFAVVAVITQHTWGTLLPAGWVGVDVFFVLSGFLITTLLLQEHAATGRIALLGFYRRRALRLFPALAVMLALVLAYSLLLADPRLRAETLGAMPLVVLYVVNWLLALTGAGLGLLNHTWSLSVEEQFYLLWPLALLLLLRLGRGAALAFCVLGIATAAVLQAVLFQPSFSARVFFASDTRGEGLMIGCALALLAAMGALQKLGDRPARWLFAAGATFLALIAFLAWGRLDGLILHGGFTLIGLSAAAVVTRLVVVPSSRLVAILSHPALAGTGRISYGMYLWHLPIAQVLPMRDGPARLVTVLALTLVAASLSYRLVERPFLRMKRRRPDCTASPAPTTLCASQ